MCLYTTSDTLRPLPGDDFTRNPIFVSSTVAAFSRHVLGIGIIRHMEDTGDTRHLAARTETKTTEGSRSMHIPPVGGWRSGSTMVGHGGGALAMTSQRALAMNAAMSCTTATDDDNDNPKVLQTTSRRCRRLVHLSEPMSRTRLLIFGLRSLVTSTFA